MCFIREGKYVYWTDKGCRVESPEPMRDIDIEQLENYNTENPENQISIFEAGRTGKNFLVVSLSNCVTIFISSPKHSIDKFWPKFTLTE